MIGVGFIIACALISIGLTRGWVIPSDTAQEGSTSWHHYLG